MKVTPTTATFILSACVAILAYATPVKTGDGVKKCGMQHADNTHTT